MVHPQFWLWMIGRDRCRFAHGHPHPASARQNATGPRGEERAGRGGEQGQEVISLLPRQGILHIVGTLAVLGDVQALALDLFIHAQAKDSPDCQEQHRRDDATPQNGDRHTLELDHQLRAH